MTWFYERRGGLPGWGWLLVALLFVVLVTSIAITVVLTKKKSVHPSSVAEAARGLADSVRFESSRSSQELSTSTQPLSSTAAASPDAVLIVTHNSGFFSCCTVRLVDIINYYVEKGRLPDRVDSSAQFLAHKNAGDGDITTAFWRDLPRPETFASSLCAKRGYYDQFSPYAELDLAGFRPFLEQYFTPAKEVEAKVSLLLSRYEVRPESTCGILYRGNDKVTETTPPTYEVMLAKALEVHSHNPSVQFLLQTDEQQFHDMFVSHFPKTISFDEVPRCQKAMIALHHTAPVQQYYVASILILARCQHLILTSGNGESWVALFRGHTRNLHQFLQPLGSGDQLLPQQRWVEHPSR